MSLIKEYVYRLRGEYTTEKLISMGMKVGSNFKRLNGVILDPSHCWLINIGVNSTVTKIICTIEEYLNKEKEDMKVSPVYGEEYTLRQNVSMEKKMQMLEDLKDKKGYID